MAHGNDFSPFILTNATRIKNGLLSIAALMLDYNMHGRSAYIMLSGKCHSTFAYTRLFHAVGNWPDKHRIIWWAKNTEAWVSHDLRSYDV